MKISATLKGQPDAFGRYAIYIRINDGKHRKTETTQYRVLPDQFLKGKVVNHPQAENINQALRVKIAKKELGQDQHGKDADFATYVDQFIKEVDRDRAYETVRQYKGEKTKLQGFRASAKLSQINPAFLKSYATYCYSLGNSGNTVWKTFKFIRMLLRKAIKEKVIIENPFDTFVMPRYKDPKKIYLTIDQVHTIENKLPLMQDMATVATWFLIGCYTGLRFGDMQKFTKKNVVNNRLVVYTGKTSEVISMPLSANVKSLLEAVKYKGLTIPNNRANEILRGVMSFCELDEPVTFHSSRHTFATMCAEAGISQEVTAKLLGHRSLRSTGIYYKITNPRIDREMEKLF